MRVSKIMRKNTLKSSTIKNSSRLMEQEQDKKEIKNGQGSMTWPDGSSYEGGFVNDMLDGHGILNWSDGTTYNGEYEENLRSGFGTICAPFNGGSYEGQWSKDMKHGQGTEFYENGDSFKGSFEHDEPNQGIVTYSDGHEETGKWHEGIWYTINH